MQTSRKQCIAIKQNGSQCQAAALPESDLCFFHDPSMAAERREAQASGGRKSRMETLDVATSDAKIQDCRDVVALLTETINQVRTGQIDPRIANSVGYLANIAIRVFEQRDLESRMEKLERLTERRTQVPDFMITGA